MWYIYSSKTIQHVWKWERYSTLQRCWIINDTIHRKQRPSYARICGIPVSENSRSSLKILRLPSNMWIMWLRAISMRFSCFDPTIMSDVTLSDASRLSITKTGVKIQGTLFPSCRQPKCKKPFPHVLVLPPLESPSHMTRTVAPLACHAKNHPVEIGRVGFAMPLK